MNPSLFKSSGGKRVSDIGSTSRIFASQSVHMPSWLLLPLFAHGDALKSHRGFMVITFTFLVKYFPFHRGWKASASHRVE